VTVALAAKSSAETPRNARLEARSEAMRILAGVLSRFRRSG
jgi:hypothetical protein